MAEHPLAARAILVAEDEYLPAMDLCRELKRLGAIIVGPAPSLERALDLIETTPRIDGAILDVSLGGEKIFPAAELLEQRGVPFLFSTGYDKCAIPARFSAVPRCEKPIGPDKLGSALTMLVAKADP